MPERRWSPRRRERPELKNKLDSPTAVHHMVRASGHDDSTCHRRYLPMYSIRIALGNSVSQSAVGNSGVGLSWIVLVLSIAVLVLVLDRQASVCLLRPSRPRTYRTVTSNANPRKQRFDDIRWAQFERTNQTVDEWVTTKVAEGHREEMGLCCQTSVGSANGTVQRGRANDSPLQQIQLAASVATDGYPSFRRYGSGLPSRYCGRRSPN